MLLILFLSFPVFGTSLSLDLDSDGVKEEVVFSPESGLLLILRGGREIWSGLPSHWGAWKLVVADLDGDGFKELLLGVKIKTRFFPERHKSLFVLGWNGNFLYARWLGSHMSKPLLDFVAFDLDGDGKDELITLELGREGKGHLLVYRWIGFGFGFLWESEAFFNGVLFSDGSKAGLRLSDGKTYILSISDGSFTLRRCP